MKTRLLLTILAALVVAINIVAQSVASPPAVNKTDELGQRQGWWTQGSLPPSASDSVHLYAYYVDGEAIFEYAESEEQILYLRDMMFMSTVYDLMYKDYYLIGIYDDIGENDLALIYSDSLFSGKDAKFKCKASEYHSNGVKSFEATLLLQYINPHEMPSSIEGFGEAKFYNYDGKWLKGVDAASSIDSLPAVNYTSAEGLREGWWSQRDEQGHTTVECYRHGKLINLRYATSADLLPIYFERIDDSGQVAVRYNFDKYGLLSGVMMDFDHSGSTVSCYYIELHEDGKRKSEGRWQYTDSPLDGRKSGEWRSYNSSGTLEGKELFND